MRKAVLLPLGLVILLLVGLIANALLTPTPIGFLAEDLPRSAALQAALIAADPHAVWYELLMPHGRSPDVLVTGGMAMVNLAPVVPASEAKANLVCKGVLGVARDPRYRSAVGVFTVDVYAATRTPPFRVQCWAPGY